MAYKTTVVGARGTSGGERTRKQESKTIQESSSSLSPYLASDVSADEMPPRETVQHLLMEPNYYYSSVGQANSILARKEGKSGASAAALPSSLPSRLFRFCFHVVSTTYRTYLHQPTPESSSRNSSSSARSARPAAAPAPALHAMSSASPPASSEVEEANPFSILFVQGVGKPGALPSPTSNPSPPRLVSPPVDAADDGSPASERAPSVCAHDEDDSAEEETVVVRKAARPSGAHQSLELGSQQSPDLGSPAPAPARAPTSKARKVFEVIVSPRKQTSGPGFLALSRPPKAVR